MGIVVILDQQQSRLGPDRVVDVLDRLDPVVRLGLLRGFVRTAGDEAQAVVGKPYALPRIIEFCLREGSWWLGIGLGGIESLGETTRESRGAAFAAASEAVDQAKRRRRWPVAVEGEQAELVERLQGMCDVLAFITARRTARQWESVDAMRQVGSGSRLAEELHVTPQTSNRLLRVAGQHEQEALEREIEDLAATALAEEAH